MAAAVPLFAFHQAKVQHFAVIFGRNAEGQCLTAFCCSSAKHLIIQIRRRAVLADAQVRRKVLGMNDISLLEVESHTAGHHALPLKHAVKLGNFRQAAGLELPQFGSGMHRLDTVLLQVLGQQTMERLNFLLGLQPTERQVMLHSLADVLALILPERRQDILCRFTRQRDPGVQLGKLGIAQIGKAFRNEIVARQFIFRMREFEQMEMQFFVRPGSELEWFKKWKTTRMRWHQLLGFGEENYRFHDHEKLAHYANAATDIEFKFPFGFKEVEGIHSRTDFDLSQHQQYSGKKIQYFDTELNESYVPYVIETSIGVDRMFLQIMSAAYCEEDLSKDGKQDSRVVLRLPAALAPVKMAIMPLVKKDGLPEKAQEIMNLLKYDFNCQYDEKDSIGKRYRRQDAIGTPFCITVDHQTLEDHAVTIRDRDTMQQERVAIDQLFGILKEKCDMQTLLRKMTE